MALVDECLVMGKKLDALAQGANDDLASRYPVKPAPAPYGLYKRCRWLAARFLQQLEDWRLKPPAAWHVRLAHAPTPPQGSQPARPLLVWALDVDAQCLSQVCRWLQSLEGRLPHHAPVLVTNVADFAAYSRLGWLVEYVPEIGGGGERYQDRKLAFIAKLYQGAAVLPVRDDLDYQGQEDPFCEWLQGGGRAADA